MESQEQKKKSQRKNRRRQRGESQQQQVPDEPHSSALREPGPTSSEHLRASIGSERGDVLVRERRGPEQMQPNPSGPSGQHMPQNPGLYAHSAPPHHQAPRFGGPRAGNQPTRWGRPPGQQQFGGPRSQPPFSSGQQSISFQPPIRQQSVRVETQPVVAQPVTPRSAWGPKDAGSDAPVKRPEPGSAWSDKSQKPSGKTSDPKSAPGEAPVEHPELGSSRPTQHQQPAKKAWGAKHKGGDSQQLQARDEPQPCVSREIGLLPTEQNVNNQAPRQPGVSKPSSKKPVHSKKKQGIVDKPLHESLEKDLVLESSPEKADVTKTMSEETASDQNSVPDPPKRRGILKHSAKYFQSEAGHPVEVNYLRVNVKDMNFKIFQYAVDFSPRNPKTLYRDALRLFLENYKINRHPAFDGRALLFAGGRKLDFGNGINAFEGSVQVNTGNESVEFYITIHLTGELNLAALMDYLRNGSSLTPYRPQALDLALMNAPINRNPALIKVGRSFYSRPAQQISLGNRLDLWTGHFQGLVIPWLDETQENPHLYLNVDVAHKGFISDALAVIEYVRQEFFFREPLKSDSRLIGWQIEKAENFLRNLKIDYKIPNQRKLSFRVASCGPSAANAKFRLDGNQTETSVKHYFENTKKIRIQYPNLPCLRDSRGRMFPMEFCTISSQAVNKQLEPNQSRKMVEESARSTVVRKQKIKDSIRNLNFAEDPCMEEFGLTLNTEFETVDTYVLKPPTIQYKGKPVPVRNGKWDGDQFIKPIDLTKWVIVNTDPRGVRENLIGLVVRDFQTVGPTCGVNVSNPKILHIEPEQGRRCFDENDFINVFKDWKDQGATFFMVIMNTRSDRIYNCIKRAAELAIYRVGVLTQCVRSETVTKQLQGPRPRFHMTAKNILLKLNAKIGGVNHALAATLKPEILDEDVMIVGADVTHPPPGSKDLSIAAVAASHDEYGFQYNMQYRLQKPKVEIIVDLKEMLIEQIEFFQKKTGKIPKRILYYRDGVGEGYYKKVLQAELTAIMQACANFQAPYRTTITFLLVQKRHHTRFFPSKQLSDGTDNQNVRAGTVVDEKITHPTEIDFFLVSHASLKGTARPTRYHLLYDDSFPAIDQETLERLTYYLCHMFARCNRSVSYPAPTYYAHCAAFRAKAWWAKQPHDENNLEREQQQKGGIRDDVVKATPMFFI